MHGSISSLIAKGTLPDPSILVTGLQVGVAFTAVRLALNAVFFKPLAYKAMGLEKPKAVQPVPALDALYHPKRRPERAALEAASATAGLSAADGEAYLLRRVATATVHARVYKFAEALWRATLYAFMVAFGLYAVVGQSWFKDPWKQCWLGWPHQVQPDKAYQYYALSMGVYTHLIMFQAIDTRRSDFWQHVLHHAVTMALITMSWVSNFVRIGSLVILLHDISDVPLELAKVVNYTKANPKHAKWASPAADGIFGIFALTFLVSRLVLFPYYVIYNTLFVAEDAVEYTADGPPPRPPCYWIFNAMLLILQALHIFWAFLILRMVYKVIVLQYLEDIRSDSEGEWEEKDGKKAKTG
ncbi:TLC domain-containing protein [Tribonema minus]|uniref:TLC domain-containing protein n=1 Tax=Tribonema minus TaxID=303371 RepID=A0A835YU22_9STRA|nr:TLC domain-containing protein [Tribonema minus]